MVGVQMRHNGQICAAGPVVGQRPPSPAQVAQPRAEQRVGEGTNAAVVDRARRVPPPGDVWHLIPRESAATPATPGSEIAPLSDSGGRQELTAAAASRSYTHSAQITKTFNAMIIRDHIG